MLVILGCDSATLPYLATLGDPTQVRQRERQTDRQRQTDREIQTDKERQIDRDCNSG